HGACRDRDHRLARDARAAIKLHTATWAARQLIGVKPRRRYEKVALRAELRPSSLCGIHEHSLVGEVASVVSETDPIVKSDITGCEPALRELLAHARQRRCMYVRRRVECVIRKGRRPIRHRAAKARADSSTRRAASLARLA